MTGPTLPLGAARYAATAALSTRYHDAMLVALKQADGGTIDSGCALDAIALTIARLVCQIPAGEREAAIDHCAAAAKEILPFFAIDEEAARASSHVEVPEGRA